MNRSIISLETLTRTYLDKPIRKDLGLSDWRSPYLTQMQKICISFQTTELTLDAANDCYACWKIYEVLSGVQGSYGCVEIPEPMDYRKVWLERVKDQNLRKIKALIIWGRRVIQDGRGFLDEIEMLLSKNDRY